MRCLSFGRDGSLRGTEVFAALGKNLFDLGVRAGTENKTCRILLVRGDSPAEKGGLMVDDVVLKFEGKAVTDAADPNFRIGENNALIYRGGSIGRMTPPIIWSIAGTDSGGGAGLSADQRAADAFGVHLCPVVAAVTAQNSRAVTHIEVMPVEVLDAQMRALADALPVGPILIGPSRPAHILTPSVTARGILNMTAVAAVEAQERAGRQQPTLFG